MDPVSIFTIVTGVVGLLSTGAKGVMKWKEHRKEKKAKQLAKAEEALMEGQVVLKRDYDRHHGFFGSLFDKGDSKSDPFRSRCDSLKVSRHLSLVTQPDHAEIQAHNGTFHGVPDGPYNV